VQPVYVIGIDLGTTNSALAYAEVHADADPFAPANVQLMAIPQLVNPGEVRDEDLLPSFLYLPGPSDFPPGTIALPWMKPAASSPAPGAEARRAEFGRLVSSAKSWLSYSGVDRTAPLLPFRAPEGVAQISPLEATRRYLAYLRHAWDAQMPPPRSPRNRPWSRCPLPSTPWPASSPSKPPKSAGFENITLLEEPQAAFYAWVERHTIGASASP